MGALLGLADLQLQQGQVRSLHLDLEDPWHVGGELDLGLGAWSYIEKEVVAVDVDMISGV